MVEDIEYKDGAVAPGKFAERCFFGNTVHRQAIFTEFFDVHSFGLLCNDSLYEYDRPVVVQMNEAGKDENELALFEAVSFPSRNEARAGAKSLNRNPSEENAIWNTDVYVTIGDKITRNTINLTEPLPAGECIEIYGVVRDDGSIDIGHNVQATVAVTIDWKPGGDIDVDI